MGQKFFDILPPPKKKQQPEAKPVIKEPELVFEAEENRRPASPGYATETKRFSEEKFSRPKRSHKKVFIFGIIVVLILAGVFGISWFSKTKIEIWPKIDALSLTEKITVDPQQKAIDFVAKILPGQIFEEEKILSQDFPATGKALREDKAKGVIQVYNAYSGLPQVLAVATRFVSSDGKIFKSLKRETIPGAVYNKGKLQPSSVNIEVQASQAGEEYNIGSSAFSIPGFIGTAKYTSFYGKSFSAMSGGFKGESSQVVQKDLDSAKGALVEKLKTEGRDAIRSKNSKDFTLLDNALFQDITESVSSQNAGAIATTFNYRVKIKSRWIGFKNEEIKNYIKGLAGPQKNLKEDALVVGNSADSVDKDSGKMILSLDVKAEVYPDINLGDLKNLLLGKTFGEAQSFLESRSEIVKIKINLPFPRNKIPSDPKRVDIKLNVSAP